MVTGLIVGHRDIGEGILRALESISGSFKHLYFISNKGLSTQELTHKIEAFTKDIQVDGLLIFVDVFGGSCWRAAKMAKSQRSHIVTGLNLPMLLSFINKRESFPFNELAGILEIDGKRGITSE